jgi:hypothetical protein
MPAQIVQTSLGRIVPITSSHKGLQQTQLQPHYEKQCEDQLYKCSNNEWREHSVSWETVQNRKCRKVAEQLGSRIPQEQCKDSSTGKYSTTHEKIGDSFSSTIVTTLWPAERPVPTSQTVSSATLVSN